MGFYKKYIPAKTLNKAWKNNKRHADVSTFTAIFLSVIIFSSLFLSCKPSTQMPDNKFYAFRLKPGSDLKKSIQDFIIEKNITAGWINTCVGSLTTYNIRFANQPNTSSANGHFEIVSLTGTLSVNGSHIHIGVSDSTGTTFGGHLSDGNIIYTTAEIVIGTSNQFNFTREKDGTTEWEELQVHEVTK